MRDEYCRKRIEELKNKKWERNLVKHYKEEIEADRKAAQEKKEKEYAAYQKTKEINDLREKQLADDLKKEKEEDKKFAEEYKIVEEKKDKERELYFKKIRRNGNKYDLTEANKIAEQIKNDINEEDDKINFYMREKNKKEIEQEKNKLRKKKIDERNELSHQLDLQIEEKQKYNELEKELDNEQARIWNTDCKKFNDDKKEIERKIRRMNEKNLEHLKKQIQYKHDKEKNKYRMSDNEYAMNKNTIMKIKELNDKLPEAA
jgi:trichohyalin